METKQMCKEERRTENDRRKQKMVEAAFFCFCSKGIEAVSIADVAREAELGEATVYRYFTNKETLALACGKRFWIMALEFVEVWTKAPDFANKNGMEQLEALIWGAYGFYQQHREAFCMIHNLDGFLVSHELPSGQMAEYKKAMNGLRPYICSAIERGKNDGSIQADTKTLELYHAVTTGVLSFMEKLAVASVLKTTDWLSVSVDLDRKLSLLLELLIVGVKASYGNLNSWL